jgi:hypothetical protein
MATPKEPEKRLREDSDIVSSPKRKKEIPAELTPGLSKLDQYQYFLKGCVNASEIITSLKAQEAPRLKRELSELALPNRIECVGMSLYILTGDVDRVIDGFTLEEGHYFYQVRRILKEALRNLHECSLLAEKHEEHSDGYP